MAISSINTLSNLPGGALPNVLDAQNTFSKNRAERQYSEAKAQYAPITLQAHAASQLAYARLMGPQYIAKLINNPDFLASLSEPQKNEFKKLVTDAATAPSGVNALNQIPQHTGIGQPSTNSFSGRIKDAFHALVGQNKPQNNLFQDMRASMQQPNQAPMQQPNQEPEQSNIPQPQVPNTPASNSKRPPNGVSIEGEQWYDKNGNPVYAEEETVPGKPTIEMDMTGGQPAPKTEPTWAEKSGEFQGIKEEGKELGKIRAQSMKELDQDYQQALQLKGPMQKLKQLITNPTFQKLRQLPGFQNLQMNSKSKIGSDEEQKLIGEFQAAAKNVVASTVKGFGGRILASEIPLSESMKLSNNDTIATMLGKEPVIEQFNEMTLQRSRIASQLMKQKHLNKGEALEQADKMVDGEKIRKQIEMELEPPPTEDDYKHMMDKYKISKEEIKKRLRAKGVKNV